GIGVMDEAAFERTADIAFNFKVIKKPAAEEAFRDDLAKAAVEMDKDDGIDVNGKDWKKETVTVTEGGK
ncbi:MAG TPA: hypothetical protein VNT04_04885, partial [Gaiellaceae bacterium]|nr:hypothetical protein [Gaiellaceae bacterium]